MIRVLLIDDEESALDVLERLLGEIKDVTVVGRYSNPLEALDKLTLTPVDAVILDIQMPGLHGMRAARKIHEINSSIHIVFTTAYTDYAVEAFEIEAVDYVLKPITKERLQNSLSRIARVVSKRQDRLATIYKPYIQCLGGFQIHLPQTTRQGILSFRRNRERELCAFLVQHIGTPVSSDLMVELLWPDTILEKAKSYLYTCLSDLRKNFRENNVQIQVCKIGEGYVLSLEGMSVDALEFAQLVERVLSEELVDEQWYVQMNTLYAGEYMEGCDFAWAIAKREELSAQYIRALRKSYSSFLKKGEISLAADSLLRVLALAPGSEKDARELIKLYMNTGERIEALKVYRQLEQEVSRNLGIQLEEETIQLYKKLMGHG